MKFAHNFPREGNHYGLPRLYHRIGRTQEGTALTARGTRERSSSSRTQATRTEPLPGANGCSPTNCWKQLSKRGTPPRAARAGSPILGKAGEAAYKVNRKRSRKPHRICHCTRFIRCIMEQVKERKWSLDACVGYARLHGLFPAE